MEVIGHRGGAALAPENTLRALRAGLDAGADGVEIDVRSTADGVLVLMHDATVDRTTSGTGRVAELDSDALRALGVPTLEAVLAVVPEDRLLIVEMKGTPWDPGHDPSEPVARAVAATLRRSPGRRVVASSFNPLALAVVRELAPEIATGVLTSEAFDLGSNLAAAVDGGHDECHVPATLVNPAFVAQAHEAGKRVRAWTVNDAEEVMRCRDAGVDGVITDDPPTALRALGR